MSGLAALALCSLGSNWGSSWEKIRKTAKTVKSVRAEFVQKKSMKILARPLVSRGRLKFVAPDTIRWEYLSPIKSLLEMRKGHVRRYVWRGGRFVLDTNARPQAMHTVLSEVANWFKGRFDKSRSFKPVLKPGSPTRIELTPRKRALTRFIKRIVVTLAKTPGAIKSVKIFESRNAVTELEFIRRKIEYR
jgi:hypothetical protein